LPSKKIIPRLEVKYKILIWGYPPHTHTHSYIHYGFYKACKYLGYDVNWLDDTPQNKNLDLSNTIIISEANVIKYLPIQSSATYFIHNLKEDFSAIENSNVYNYLVYHDQYSWDGVTKVDDYFWFCEKTKTPVIMWGTDLLPHEIDNLSPVLYNENEKNVYFVGTVQGNNTIEFSNVCSNNGKNFINLGGYTGFSEDEKSLGFYDYKKSIDIMRESYISFDIREQCHVNNGYVPCRLFKNMSYGKWTGSNSIKLKQFFGDRLTFNSNLNLLYSDIVKDYKNCNFDMLKDNMNYIKKNHTYLNRVQSLLSIL
jgi:hypothetical protein